MTDDNDLVRRAMAAYFKSGGFDQPANTSGISEHNGLLYVVLDSGNGPLAVYRVRQDNRLKRMRRWPSAVTAGR